MSIWTFSTPSTQILTSNEFSMLFQDEIRRRVLRLDGAMGTEIQRLGLEGNNEKLNLTHPDVILDIHRAYIRAGADIIESNTFSANSISQSAYGLESQAEEMALKGAVLARKAADESPRKVWVAGSIGPTSVSLSLAQDLSRPEMRPCDFDRMAEVYATQVRALITGGVDLLLIETAFDALTVKATLYAIQKINPDFPVAVSITLSDRSGRTLTGQTPEAFYTAIRHYPLAAFGINCSTGADEMLPRLQDIASFCDVPIICYPNAGLPNEVGGYDETPLQMAGKLKAFDGLVNILGGCCGTTPEHIKAFPELSPRPIPEKSGPLSVSGLEMWTIDTQKRNFTLIGERTNVAGSRKFARLISSGNYDEALQVAAAQIEAGAGIIDINMDDAMIDSPEAMQCFVRTLQNDPAVARAALMIDSSDWDCILAGLKNAQGKCIVNSISLKDGEADFLAKAAEIHRLGAAMVVMAFDEQGQAISYNRKIEICARAYKLLLGIGIAPQDIIFDVNVLSVGTGIPEHRQYAIDFIDAVRWIKRNLPGVYTSGGVSNLSFAFRGNDTLRSAMHSVFLYHAIRAGLDMAIVNPAILQQYDDIPAELRTRVEDVILCRDDDATERLIAFAAGMSQARSEESSAMETSAGGSSAEERLIHALVAGDSRNLESDLMEALSASGQAVNLIEGPLMAGMEEVGRRFSEGKMFLPQVVKSAKVMKDAVAILEPYMGAGDKGTARPLIVLATVKGDVHDIGKNITGIVLRCNGFDILDLGVMVEKETIIEEAAKHGAVMIGVSGLITPSLFQMEELCREMQRRGLSIPLFVGGATTSPLHTAVKLAPLYAHVFHSPDASAAALMAKRCLIDREAFENVEHARQEELRKIHSGRKPLPTRLEPFPEDSYLRVIPDDIPLTYIPLPELLPHIDWSIFRAVWGLKGSSDESIITEGRALLGEMVEKGDVQVRLAARFFAASREGDKILSDRIKLPMLRQEEGKCLSLADYVPSSGKGPFGVFAISVQGSHPVGCQCPGCRNDYQSMMQRAVHITLAETASAWLDRKLEYLGSKMAKPAAGYSCCPDHSLKRDILSLLPEGIGISLSESCAMQPDASICGFIIFHPEAGYPPILHISKEQYQRYARERGFSQDEARSFLSHLL